MSQGLEAAAGTHPGHTGPLQRWGWQSEVSSTGGSGSGPFPLGSGHQEGPQDRTGARATQEVGELTKATVWQPDTNVRIFPKASLMFLLWVYPGESEL